MTAIHSSRSLVDFSDRAECDVWNSIAQCYRAFNSPFVPCREDIAEFERAVSVHAESIGTRQLRAVMLGVTPSIALMKWPVGSRIVAADMSSAVINAIWPGDVYGLRRAVCASWLEMPVSQKSCDVVVGDGSLATCNFPDGVRKLLSAVAGLLVKNGAFVFRTYVRSRMEQSIDDVFDALLHGDGMSVDIFKMRLYMAMQRSADKGVAVKDASKILESYKLDGKAMKEKLGWSDAAIEPFSRWSSSPAIYSFPSLPELRELLDERFEIVSIKTPTYELGDCCPTIVVHSRM